MGKLTAQQMLALKVSERTMSVLSILGSLFIMGTFVRWHYFRKPINRLVFYASWGNVMANVATLISTSALPLSDQKPSSLCEFQGVLIQWFMMADSLWVFCMALNVMLVFFYQFNSHRLRKLEKYYLAFSYGVPFVPAMVYVTIDHHGPNWILGNAVLWCWIDSRAEWMRIAFFYGPVWVMVACTLMIYIITGRTIFKRRKTLREFSKTRNNPVPVLTNPFTAAHLNGIERKTEISIQYTTDTPTSDPNITSPAIHRNDSRSSFSSTRILSSTVEISAPTTPTPTSPARLSKMLVGSTRVASETASQHDEVMSNYSAAVTSNPKKVSAEARHRSISTSNTVPTVRRAPPMEGNRAAWSYFKVAFLMFAALFIVWVPSTVNRLQQFIHKGNPVFGLNLASALVLPLQGFWNSMVYISTTWPECKRAFRELVDHGELKKNTRPLPEHHERKESNRTLIDEENLDFDNEVPLSVMLKQGPPSPTAPSRPSTRNSLKEKMSVRQERRQ